MRGWVIGAGSIGRSVTGPLARAAREVRNALRTRSEFQRRQPGFGNMARSRSQLKTGAKAGTNLLPCCHICDQELPAGSEGGLATVGYGGAAGRLLWTSRGAAVVCILLGPGCTGITTALDRSLREPDDASLALPAGRPTVQRVRGASASAALLLPEPGDIWSEPRPATTGPAGAGRASPNRLAGPAPDARQEAAAVQNGARVQGSERPAVGRGRAMPPPRSRAPDSLAHLDSDRPVMPVKEGDVQQVGDLR